MIRLFRLSWLLLMMGCSGDPLNYDVYPSKPITIIVPYGPGGTTDVFARAFAKVVTDYLPGDAAVVIVNKPGGSSTIGVTALQRAKVDGYTVAMLPTGVIEVQPHLHRVRWTLEDFAPVIGLLDIPAAINVVDHDPIKNFQQWLDHTRNVPGTFMYSTAGGVGSSTHIAMQAVQEELDIKLRWIPFEGEAASRAALLGGKIHGNFSIPNVHRGGELRPLIFVTTSKPTAEVYANTPTFAELGYDYEASFPLGVIAAKGTPPQVINMLHDAFKSAMEDPQIKKLYQTYDLSPAYRSPDELKLLLQRNSELARQSLVKLGMIR